MKTIKKTLLTMAVVVFAIPLAIIYAIAVVETNSNGN